MTENTSAAAEELMANSQQTASMMEQMSHMFNNVSKKSPSSNRHND